MQIDHLVFAVHDLESGIRQIAGLTGISPATGGLHPGWGTRNALLALGPETYLEVIAPDPNQPRPPHGRALGVDRTDLPRLTRWAARTDNIPAAAALAEAAGFSTGKILDGSRKKPDGSLLRWQLSDPYIDPADGIFPFLIDWLDSPHPANHAPAGCRLLQLRAEHPDAGRISALTAAAGLDLEIARGPKPALIAALQTPKGVVVLR